MTDTIKNTFEDNGYKILEKDGDLKITRKHSFLAIFLYSLVVIVTLPLLFTGDYRMILLLVLVVGFPFIYRRWMLPRSILISHEDNGIYISKYSRKEPVVAFEDIQSIEVDENVISSDVSPFKEGYQDFVYTFSIKTIRNKVFELFHLEFRRPEEDLIKSIFDYFNDKLTVSGQPTPM